MTKSEKRTISVNEWLDLLTKLEQPKDSPGLTLREIQDQLGVGEDKARRLVRLAVDHGCCVVGKKIVTSISGMRAVAPTYAFVAPK